MCEFAAKIFENCCHRGSSSDSLRVTACGERCAPHPLNTATVISASGFCPKCQLSQTQGKPVREYRAPRYAEVAGTPTKELQCYSTWKKKKVDNPIPDPSPLALQKRLLFSASRRSHSKSIGRTHGKTPGTCMKTHFKIGKERRKLFSVKKQQMRLRRTQDGSPSMLRSDITMMEDSDESTSSTNPIFGILRYDDHIHIPPTPTPHKKNNPRKRVRLCTPSSSDTEGYPAKRNIRDIFARA